MGGCCRAGTEWIGGFWGREGRSFNCNYVYCTIQYTLNSTLNSCEPLHLPDSKPESLLLASYVLGKC